jgi:hypothetical protein
MITLQDVLNDLSYGEFQHIKIGNFHPDEHDAEPDPRAYAQLTSHVNKALTVIFTRFSLREQEVLITLDDDITNYFLHPDYTVSTGTNPVLYLIDTVADPFQDNVAKIEEVYEVGGKDDGTDLLLNMNDVDDQYSVFNPRFNLIQIPDERGIDDDWEQLLVKYRALHPKIDYAYGMDPSTIELEIPEQFLEPLLFYVAGRYMATLPGQEGPSFFAKYQGLMEEINRRGLFPQSAPTNGRFNQKGFC